MEGNPLPAINASLNGVATVLLTAGFVFIKTGRKQAHRNSMVAAFAVSVIFLFFYVLNRIIVKGVHTPFSGEGVWVPIYYVMLITHIILAIAVVPLVLRTLYLGIKGNFDVHRKWARVTFPIWYYVSVTGVLVFFFLYVWFPGPPPSGG